MRNLPLLAPLVKPARTLTAVEIARSQILTLRSTGKRTRQIMRVRRAVWMLLLLLLPVRS